MNNQKTITVSEDAYEQLNAERCDLGMTWDRYLTVLQEGAFSDQVDVDGIELVAEMLSGKGFDAPRENLMKGRVSDLFVGHRSTSSGIGE